MQKYTSMSIKWLIISAFLMLISPAHTFGATILEQGSPALPDFTSTTTYSWVAYLGTTNFPYATFHGIGNALYVSAYLKRVGTGSGSDTMRMYFRNATGVELDCTTATKSFDEWGITDTEYTLVSIGQFSGTACNIPDATSRSSDYIFAQFSGSTYAGLVTPTIPYSWFIITDTVPSYASSTITRIDLVSPYDNQPYVSSTSPITLEASGYINKSLSDLENVDNKDGLRIKWNVYSNVQENNCIDVICAIGGGIGGINYYSDTGYGTFPSQWFNVSTSTGRNLKTGFYTLTTSIIIPTKWFGFTNIFGISFGYDVIIKKITHFSVGIPNAGQIAMNELYGAVQAGQNILSATSSEASLSSCSPFSFNLGICLAVLFFPSTQDLQNLMQYAHDNFLTRAPWGYATRMVAILTNTASSTSSSNLPTWVVTFPSIQGVSGSPLAGHTLTFDMQEMLDNGSTTINGIIDPISGKTMRQIIEPWILLFIGISALIIVFHDIMGMGKHTNKYADK
jgi:hypothetical protein